jgi:nicotinate-nucleotide adenylyltransferase
LILGEEAREQLELDRVLFVPAGQPWRKTGREIAPAEDRLAMLRLAVEDNPAFEVSEVELNRAGPSYTVETLASLKKRHAGAELFCIMGQDALSDFPNWHDPGRIAQLATLAVAAREGDDTFELPQAIGARVVTLAMPAIAISGSDIRARVAAGRSIRYRVPPAVERYIREKRLYRD